MLRALTHALASTSALGSAAGGLAASAEHFTPAVFGGLLTKRWATKKQGGSTKNKKDSQPKHLGPKMWQGELIFPGQTIVRQRGTTFHPGLNVGMGRDHTLFSRTVGFIKYREDVIRYPRRPGFRRRFVDVLPLNDDWSAGYADKVAEMVAARWEAKLRLLGPRAKYVMRVGRPGGGSGSGGAAAAAQQQQQRPAALPL